VVDRHEEQSPEKYEGLSAQVRVQEFGSAIVMGKVEDVGRRNEDANEIDARKNVRQLWLQANFRIIAVGSQ
jgi:hypothetical protein